MKKRWIVLILAVVVLVGGYFGWQYLRRSSAQQLLGTLETAPIQRGSLTAQVGATGTIQARQQATLNFSISGRIGAVNVEMGDPVKKGQELAALDAGYFPQQVAASQADLINAQKTLNDLKRSNTAFAQAELDLANARKSLDDAETAFTKAQENYNGGWLKAAQDWVDQARARYLNLRRSRENTMAGQFQLQQAYQEYVQALQELQKAQAYHDMGLGSGTTDSKSNLDIAQGKYDLAKANFDDAQAKYDRLKDGVPLDDIAAAQARVDAAQAVLNQTRIIAPFSGTILAVQVLPGDMVSPATAVLVIADLAELHVDVPIAEVDYNRLAVGQPAELVLDAIYDKTYHGTVQEIEMSSSTTSGSVSYPVKVVLSDADAKVLPGMTVAVSIEVSHLDNVLLVPNRAVRTSDGSRIVYRMINGVAEPVEIILGASSDTMSEVKSGDLKEGDLIVLNPPSLLTSGPSSGGMGSMRFGQ